MFLRMHPLSRSYTLDGAVGDTYFPPARPQLVPNAMDPTCLGGRENGPSLPGLVGGSYTFGDSVHYNSESNPLVHSCVNYTPSNTTRNAELGSARVEDAYTGLPQNAVQEARTLANGHQYANCLTMQCLYPGREEMLCLQELSCGTVSSHFASHGIENKSRTEIIRCEWKGCVANVTRHAFVRHIREVHLQHLRGASAHKSENNSRQQT
ncbi:hypothetical protein EDD16DRAFT_1616798 [Pisolithus croceorrhizus]|nr:hypothetical protein EDD16DRAFT_1616798 [Pisolithus croceorrhizus]